MQKMSSSTSSKMFEADVIETSADSPLLDVGTEDEIESRGDDIEDIESSTRMMVQETTNSESKIYKKGKNLEKAVSSNYWHFFLFLGHFVTTSSEAEENSLPATFQGQSKLGFSIAQIMGFMGNNSGGIGGGSTKSQSVEDKEIKTKEEDMKRPQQTHFEMASNHGANTVTAEHSQQQPLPLMPKPWRPQPFRDYGISHSSQPK